MQGESPLRFQQNVLQDRTYTVRQWELGQKVMAEIVRPRNEASIEPSLTISQCSLAFKEVKY